MTSNDLKLLFPDEPFLGASVFGVQGVNTIMRHMVMSSFVSYLRRDHLVMLEVGSWIGNSALTWGQAIDAFCPGKGTVLCVDPLAPYFSEGDAQRGVNYSGMNAIAERGLAYELFRHNTSFMPLGVNLQHIRSTLLQVFGCLKEGGFDLIYIDASHQYEDVLQDIRLASRLLKQGGILCGDDLELRIDECDEGQARANLTVDFVADQQRGVSYHPGVTCAVADFFGREVWSKFGTWAMQKSDADVFVVPELAETEAIIPRQFGEAERERAMLAFGMSRQPQAPAFY